MSPPRYIYQRTGGPLLSWAGGPPSQTRAADAKALGSLGSYSSPPGNSLGLPRGGAPEFLGNYSNIPSSNPPILQRGLGSFWSAVRWGAEPVVAKEVNKKGEPKALIMEGFGNYMAVGDDSTPSDTLTLPSLVIAGHPVISAVASAGLLYALYRGVRALANR